MDGATILSHSTRVRGLKSYVVYRIDTISNVALYTSAWIEIVMTQLADINSNVSHSTRVRGLK